MNLNQTDKFEEATDASEPEPPESSGSLEPTVTITVDEGIEGVDEQWLHAQTNLAIGVIQKQDSFVAIRVVNDQTMSDLHEAHSGISDTTDVLTFNHGSTESEIHADIAICHDVAERRVRELKHDLRSELLLYIVHGLLHCSGFDDLDEKGYQQMHAEEDRILTAIGVGSVWGETS